MAFDASDPVFGDAPLLPKQRQLVRDRHSKILIFRGGYRAGKTSGLVAKAIDLGFENWPHPVLAVEPTFPMIRSVFVDTAMRLCDRWKLRCKWKESKKILTIGRRFPATIWCRSADSPRSLEGLTVAAGVGDEWELWAIEALKVFMARISVGELQQIVLGGTPEGYGPGYQLVERNKKPGTVIIVSPTTDNLVSAGGFVRADYVEDMASRLTAEEVEEKLKGERSPPSARVYTRFDRRLHCGTPCVDAMRGRLEVWCDFNVAPMAWGFVLVDDVRKAFHVVGELVVDGTDSQRQAAEAAKWIRAWRAKLGFAGEHKGTSAICDASGDERSAITPLSHVVNLERAGFKPKFGATNPRVDDRVASVQKVLGGRSPLDGRQWPVRLTFDEKAAPYIVSCISSQPRAKDGSPSKDTKIGLDHGSDLVGYGVMWHSPATMPAPNEMETERSRQWADSKTKGRS